MAVLVVMAVRDSAINAFMRPFFVPAVGMGIRSFTDECNTADSPVHKHADDYELYELGVFDEESGAIDKLVQPRMIARAKDLLTKGD